jgi:hypothetical protein
MFLHFGAVCPAQVAALAFCSLRSALLSKGGFGHVLFASNGIGDVFSHSLHFKI